MARTGSFGRQPRSAPSLTSTLVAIAREYQNQRAQNIMDAWQAGGMFEGKKATDDVVLAFWKNKAAGVSKDDPLYDTYKNAHTQLDYNIHESKMTAWYATSAKGDAQDKRMVGFYLGWAKKVPKDSEFYRVLQRDAGQYMRVQRAAASVRTVDNTEENYQKAQSATQRNKEAGGEYLIETLRRIAQEGNVELGIPQAIASVGSGSDLTDFTQYSPEVMLLLMAAIAPEGKTVSHTRVGSDIVTAVVGNDQFKGSDTVLFYDDDKRPVTGTDVLRKLGNLDRNFVPGEPFDVAYATKVMDRQINGLNERIRRAKKTGHSTDVESLKKSKGYVALLGREIAAYPIQQGYMEARADYDDVISDPAASMQAKLNAWNTYAGELTSLSNDPRIEADSSTRGRLMAEVRGDPGVPTLNESFTGLANSQFDPARSTEAAQNKQAIDLIVASIDSVASGERVWSYGSTDSNGLFTPHAGGGQIGAATREQVAAGGLNPHTVTVPDPAGGLPLTMTVTATPIYATAKHPVTGDPLKYTNGQPIGWAYDLPEGGGWKTQYSFSTANGPIFTDDPLWDDKAMSGSKKGGQNRLEVDFSDEVAASLGYSDKDPVTGEYKVKPPDDNADRPLPNGVTQHAATTYDKTTGALKERAISFDPQTLAWSSGTRGMLGHDSNVPDPMKDFRSLTLSLLMGTPEGRTILVDIDKYPEYKVSLQDDAYAYADTQRDEKTGAWLPETADQTKLGYALSQQNVATTAKSLNGFLVDAAATFTRMSTGSPAGKSDTVFPDLKPLATDLIKGTPFEALGNIFFNKTSTVKPPVSQDRLGMGVAIKPVAVIKTPSLPSVDVQQAAVYGQQPGGTKGQKNNSTTQQGSAPPSTNSQQQSGSQPPGGSADNQNPGMWGHGGH